MPATTKTLAEEFTEQLQADQANEEESLTCYVCGATGLADCVVSSHAATLAGYSAMNSRTLRIWAYRISREG